MSVGAQPPAPVLHALAVAMATGGTVAAVFPSGGGRPAARRRWPTAEEARRPRGAWRWDGEVEESARKLTSTSNQAEVDQR